MVSLSKERSWDRLLAGIVVSNPADNFGVWLFWILCVVSLCDTLIPRLEESYWVFVCVFECVCVCVSLNVIKCFNTLYTYKE